MILFYLTVAKLLNGYSCRPRSIKLLLSPTEMCLWANVCHHIFVSFCKNVKFRWGGGYEIVRDGYN